MIARDVLCFSHLRWNFVYQRPNHLMSRCARSARVLFIEEPVCEEGSSVWLEQLEVLPNLIRVVPHLPTELCAEEQIPLLRGLLDELCTELKIETAVHWFYTPMMLPLAEHLPSSLVVYDCMDELSQFHFAPPELLEREQKLLAKADVVFTGGMALYEAKRGKHNNVHGVPSSVDVEFFRQARSSQPEPADQASIPHPRIGYCGVIDERIDLALLATLARERPALQLVMVGPVVKIEPEALPRLPNIHYLGGKPYQELPAYLSGWDAALMPFALNEATRFISPTKTPEYLAAGRRVVSTPIADVVEPYGRLGLVRIAHGSDELLTQVDAALQDNGTSDQARDEFLAKSSWDTTWQRMRQLCEKAAIRRELTRSSRPAASATT